MAAMAIMVKRLAAMRPTRSPKLSRPMARPPRRTVKLSHERKVRSLAKKTLGSTRVGSAIRLPGLCRSGQYRSVRECAKRGSRVERWSIQLEVDLCEFDCQRERRGIAIYAPGAV
jgi:hypothetical protein